MGCRHGCRDSSAHGHNGEGKEGEDVLGVHFGKRGAERGWVWRVVWMDCWSVEFEVDSGCGWRGLEDLNAGRRWLMLVDVGWC